MWLLQCHSEVVKGPVGFGEDEMLCIDCQRGSAIPDQVPVRFSASSVPVWSPVWHAPQPYQPSSQGQQITRQQHTNQACGHWCHWRVNLAAIYEDQHWFLSGGRSQTTCGIQESQPGAGTRLLCPVQRLHRSTDQEAQRESSIGFSFSLCSQLSWPTKDVIRSRSRQVYEEDEVHLFWI